MARERHWHRQFHDDHVVVQVAYSQRDRVRFCAECGQPFDIQEASK